MKLDEQLKRGATDVIRLLGVDMQLINADGTGSRNLRVASYVTTEETIVNAYGIDAIVGYSLPVAPEPKKFDRLSVAGQSDMVIHSVHPFKPNGVLVAYKYVLKQ